MNSINSVLNQQTQRIAQNSALRKAAVAPKPPALTRNEASLIEQQFSDSKIMNSYSLDGKVLDHYSIRGSKIDTRV